MYCINVTPGSERIKVRQVASGFNPKYREAEGKGKISDKRLVVPGYVFTMQFTPGARKVPDAEWKIIEAVSDPHPSTVDQRKRKMVEGPLKSIEDMISVIQADRVKVTAMMKTARKRKKGKRPRFRNQNMISQKNRRRR